MNEVQIDLVPRFLTMSELWMLVGMSTPSKPEPFVVRKNFPVGFDSIYRSTWRASGFWRVDAPSRIQGSWV
jgi:hypothetical protein